MIRITLILTLISISTLAWASEWKYLIKDYEGTMYYLDTESILVEGDTRTLWRYKKFKEPQAIGNKIVYASKAQLSVNCTKRTLRILVIQILDAEGKQVQYVDLRPYTSPEPIIPDTVDDLTRQYICSIKKSAE
jgi:hypothetical protein